MGSDSGEEVAVEDPESEATREIEKSLGKLTNTLRKTELTEPQVKNYVNTFLSAFKDELHNFFCHQPQLFSCFC